ncbi:MAG TPA: ADOP family duplicated permease, partial [Gemmatimonadaceae bacterium]|nr:ADOP family duplicated permease [Gemmatimonadaceae bacterium]
FHVRAALARLRELFRHRARVAAEQDEEFSFHLEMETAENVRRGMSEADARRAAVLRFGGMQRFREDTSDARGVVALDNLARDTRFALRRLRRAPAFAAGVIATLGIGIGAAAGIGTIVYDVLLRDLPYEKPGQLVHVGFITPGIAAHGDLQSPATYFHFAKTARSFTALGAYWTSDAFNVTDGDAPERVTIAMMTPNVFTLLGVRPLLGQLFEPVDTSWFGERLLPILISESLWRRRYGADSSILGRHIDIDHGARYVLGVLPRSFDFPTPSVDIFYPAAVPLNRPQITSRYFNVIGRLRDGVDASRAEAELNTLIPSLTDRFPAITHDMLQQSRAHVSVESLKTATVASVRDQLVLLGALVAVVLLIATTNVVNLFLLRIERAGFGVAIALSLGASRLALARRFVIEGIVFGLASAIVALPAAALVLATKFGFTEREIPRLHEAAFTWETMALVLGCALLIGTAVGLIALTRTGTVGLFDRLRAPRSTASGTWRRAQNGLVAFQVAIALVLLVAAGLLGRSFWNLRNAAIGFQPENAMTFQLSLPYGEDGYVSYGKSAAFHAKVVDRLAALPGVTSVGLSLRLPLASRGVPHLDVQLQADDGEGRPAVAAAANMASADYFHTMGIPLRAGRSFRAGDLRGTPAVVVSERLAKSLFGTTEIVGRRVLGTASSGAPSRAFTIVGVSGDVQWERIEDGYVPMVYFPILRDLDGLPADSNPVWYEPRDVQYAIRGKQLPTGRTIQGIVTELDRRVPAVNVRTLGSIVDNATARVRLTMLLIAVAGTAALLLAVIGVYSVVAYAASGRMREFGIRLALGAAPARVGGMVLRDGLRLVGIGTVAGVLAALAATRFLRALLYEVKPTSLAEFGIATVLLVVVTLVAMLLPARRAARTHPAVVLRGE